MNRMQFIEPQFRRKRSDSQSQTKNKSSPKGIEDQIKPKT